MVKFKALIDRYDRHGEKTGWTFIIVKARYARRLHSSKVGFRVKGHLDSYPFEALALLPIGKGDFMLPLNAAIRKAIHKKKGDILQVEMSLDSRPVPLSADLMKCLKQEPASLAHFKSLSRSHQNYYSKWIESAKTVHTKTKRIVMAVTALAQGQGYPEMLRAQKKMSFES